MQDITEAFKAFLAKIGEILDIFDFSFFISGASTVGAFIWASRLDRVCWPAFLNGGQGIFIIIISCYLCGLVSFSFGRWIRQGICPKKVQARHNLWLLEILTSHHLLDHDLIKPYLHQQGDERQLDWRLYVRLWAELRQTTALAPSMALLKRYWTLAATYDGLLSSLLCWFLVASLRAGHVFASDPPTPLISASFGVIIFIASWRCFKEANRHTKNQYEELVASIATQIGKK